MNMVVGNEVQEKQKWSQQIGNQIENQQIKRME